MGFALDLAFVFSRAERVDESRALLLVQVKGAVCHQAYQVVASVRLKVSWASHGRQFTKNSVAPPLLLHQSCLTLAPPYDGKAVTHVTATAAVFNIMFFIFQCLYLFELPE